MQNFGVVGDGPRSLLGQPPPYHTKGRRMFCRKQTPSLSSTSYTVNWFDERLFNSRHRDRIVNANFLVGIYSFAMAALYTALIPESDRNRRQRSQERKMQSFSGRQYCHVPSLIPIHANQNYYPSTPKLYLISLNPPSHLLARLKAECTRGHELS